MNNLIGKPASTHRRHVAKRVRQHMNELSSTKTPIYLSSDIFNSQNNVSSPTEHNLSTSSGESDHEYSGDFQYINFQTRNSSSDENSIFDPSMASFKDQLINWVIKYNITTTALSDLLKLLREFETFQNLPKDGRTLLKTKSEVNTKNLGEGKFCYFGLQKHIERQLESFSESICTLPNELQLELSVDGLPISKSTKSQLWPTQCSIINLGDDRKPFVVSIYFGNNKPDNIHDYFEELLQELAELQLNGIFCKSMHFSVKLVRIVADAPARSLIKQVKNHNSYNGCEKCTVKGEYRGRVIFPDINSEIRTDANFEQQLDKQHHNGNSPFTKLGFGLVTGVPLDYMHLICLGVTKKLLRAWVKGPLPYKIPTRDIAKISGLLCDSSYSCPNEFNRKPRSLKELDMWKATEFRTFLLFTGPVVLRNVLPRKLYNHFMLLSISTRILVSPNAKNVVWNNYAEVLLRKFVELVSKLYAPEFLVYNVHSLIHICSDVKLHGPLDNFSAFRYENNMQVIKRTLRAKFKPFEQVVNRICEQDCLAPVQVNRVTQLKSTSGNNCFLLKNGSVILIDSVDNNLLFCRRFKKCHQFFNNPCSSQQLFIFLCSELTSINVIEKTEISTKCWLIPYKDKYVSMPLCNWSLDK